MEANYTITVDAAPPDTEVSHLEQCLRKYNASIVENPERISLLLTLLDSNKEFTGGLFGKISYQWLFVDTLWVSEQARGKGQGRRLLVAAEQAARAHGCGNAWVDTFSFQARSFYEKNGYLVFGELPDYPPGHTRYFLRKSLKASQPSSATFE
ncbi:MAG: GNAT family N-acetyltransferase [Acidobacteriaceae bacterium]|nr:GNAT family N-acetyltransferase [Acidobacteriaceae bacterium]MBV9778911.1 GNAT family N-acetyltransferase [Acidobacteriaceae bacterium]